MKQMQRGLQKDLILVFHQPLIWKAHNLNTWKKKQEQMLTCVLRQPEQNFNLLVYCIVPESWWFSIDHFQIIFSIYLEMLQDQFAQYILKGYC